MIRLLKRFFDDVHRIANFVTANPMQDVLVTLGQTDRDLLSNFRRRKPSVKREVKDGMHSANNPLGRTESL